MIHSIDTSPLIALSGIHHLDLLHKCCGRVAVPRAVHTEIVEQGAGWTEARSAQAEILTGTWLVTVETRDSTTLRSLRKKLGAGESECLEWARVSGAQAIIDDFTARKEAERLGIGFFGTLHILAKSKREGHIAAVRPLLTAIRRNGIYYSDKLVGQYLAALGESL
ncbi:MAG: DUF3368 domain-containing protein [Verrucomicrobia bacterium]|nr:DUF3368 domain-containing protein [Verrucomicrobiota bacterium]